MKSMKNGVQKLVNPIDEKQDLLDHTNLLIGLKDKYHNLPEEVATKLNDEIEYNKRRLKEVYAINL